MTRKDKYTRPNKQESYPLPALKIKDLAFFPVYFILNSEVCSNSLLTIEYGSKSSTYFWKPWE